MRNKPLFYGPLRMIRSAWGAHRLALSAAILFLGMVQVRAVEIFYDYGGDNIIKVADFPRTDDFRTQEGEHVDAGYMYKQLRIFWIPVWNYDKKWCGYISGQRFVPLTKDKLDEAAALARITLPDEPPVPAWDVYGGKILFLGALLVVGFVYLGRDQHAKPAVAAPPRFIPARPPPQEQAASAPVRFSLKRSAMTALPATLNGTCVHCGQHLAFEPAMLNTNIQCPGCSRETPLGGSPSVGESRPDASSGGTSLMGKLVKAAPAEIKGRCVHCGQKLAFERAALNTTITCPACGRETLLAVS